jgi:hypothetical protein
MTINNTNGVIIGGNAVNSAVAAGSSTATNTVEIQTAVEEACRAIDALPVSAETKEVAKAELQAIPAAPAPTRAARFLGAVELLKAGGVAVDTIKSFAPAMVKLATVLGSALL